MRTWLAVVDRTAILFLGLAAGAAIGFAFGGSREAPPAPVMVTPETAPPPPATRGTARSAATTPSGPECAVPIQQRLLETVAAGRPVRIGVFGDSFGDGVWSGLARLLPPKAGFDVVKFSQQATGFTRYKSLNLEDHARAQLGDQPIDIAVISFGANDTQGVIDREGHLATLMSPAWQKEIGLRIDGFVRVLRAHGAMLYWVGLPRMRTPAFDADITNMDAFYAAKMHALGIPFIDTRPAASDATGRYAAYLPDPQDGHPVLMRADDGIHMSMNGYVWITRGLAQRIRAYVDAARTMAGVAPAVPAVAIAALPTPAAATPSAPAVPPRSDSARPAPRAAPRLAHPVTPTAAATRAEEAVPPAKPVKPPPSKEEPAGRATPADDAPVTVPDPA